ncbi:HIT-type Zinc finger family protein [Tasmannia lanceolata]|uniref:HIT-type Zinc finger family protein n=1 Tax=Tasmannia lanceolata TaxID=3420 RepID=UPI004063B011
MGPRQECQVCNGAQSKYKCPSCLVPYCSLNCFKKHKEIPCTKSLSSEAKPSIVLVPERSYQVDEETWVLQREQLESIVVSKKIQDALNDEELRKFIYKIDCSTDPENELAKAMEGEVFCQFTDKILSIVSPQEQSSLAETK